MGTLSGCLKIHFPEAEHAEIRNLIKSRAVELSGKRVTKTASRQVANEFFEQYTNDVMSIEAQLKQFAVPGKLPQAKANVDEAARIEAEIDKLIQGDEDIGQAVGQMFVEANRPAQENPAADSGFPHHVVKIEIEPSLAELSLSDFIVKAKETARNLFSGKVFKNRSDGSEIMVPWQGIKHALSGMVNRNEAAVSLKLNEVIESAIPARTEKDNKDRRNIKAVHFYDASVMINGEKVDIELVVREHLDGKRYYDHYEVKEQSAGQSGESEINQKSHQPFTNRSSDTNIDQVTGEVKADLTDIIKGINDSIGEKGSVDIGPLVDLGRSIWAEGYTSLEAFTARSKELLSDGWDKVKDLIGEVWNKLKEERGSISTKKKYDIDEVNELLDMAARQDKALEISESPSYDDVRKKAAEMAFEKLPDMSAENVTPPPVARYIYRGL